MSAKERLSRPRRTPFTASKRRTTGAPRSSKRGLSLKLRIHPGIARPSYSSASPTPWTARAEGDEMIAAIGEGMRAAWELVRRWGISDSDAQILYFVGSLVVAVGLSIITGYYAWQNKRMADQNTRMVEELQRQREAMARQLREMRIQTRLGLYRPR